MRRGTFSVGGSLLRLLVGILTDKYGGRPVFVCVLLLSALGVLSGAFAESYFGFLMASKGNIPAFRRQEISC